MRAAVLGGTRGMGRAVARALAERGDDVFLLGRDPEELARSAADLATRAGRADTHAFAPCDLEDPTSFAPALEAARAALGDLDAVIVTAGMFASQDELEADLHRAQRLLTVNFVNTVLFCEHARQLLLTRGGGTLCVFSSVAGDRGRKPVILYGASKAGLSQYLEGLDHKFRAQGLKTLCVKPGFVKTGMTAGLKPPPFAGEPEAVAREVVAAIDSGAAEIYTPSIWRLVMFAIQMLPRAVMRKISF